MRRQFCDAMVARAAKPDMVFLSGDLGFMALEPLQQALGERFVNAGVAEQNMMSIAAAMSRLRLETWAYSIAPFCYARPFEQIRNDIALHDLPVKLVGNGGGYGYGVMGPTHHAIEDYGVLLTLPGMRVCVPTFDEDLAEAVPWVGNENGPCYLRLGRGEPPAGWKVPDFAPWRALTAGEGPPMVVVGPLAGTYVSSFESLPVSSRPNLWAVSVLPIEAAPPPEALLAQIKGAGALLVAEEHVAQGGFGAAFALWLARRGLCPLRFGHLHALAHRYPRYGSQAFLRRESKLDPGAAIAALHAL
jgi:transketolase